MLTKAEITAGGIFLDDTSIAQWLTMFRSLAAYKATPGLYPGLVAKLASLKSGVIVSADVVKAQILNAAMLKIEALGAGQESLGGKTGAGAVSWSHADNRNEFVLDALNSLYEVPVQRPTSAAREMPSNITICALHRRSYSFCGCNRTVLVY